MSGYVIIANNNSVVTGNLILPVVFVSVIFSIPNEDMKKLDKVARFTNENDRWSR